MTPAQQQEVVGILGRIDEAAELQSRTIAAIEATRNRLDNPLAHLKNEDIQAIENRLYAVLHSSVAIRQLASDACACGGSDESPEAYLVAIQEMARANAKGLDACIQKLDGGHGVGCFTGELATD